MITYLARSWWALTLRGVAAILFGIGALYSPPAAIAALVVLFAAYALVDGVVDIVHAVRAGSEGEKWGALLFEGIALSPSPR